MVLEKGSFGQMPIVQPQKMGSFGQDTQKRQRLNPNYIFVNGYAGFIAER